MKKTADGAALTEIAIKTMGSAAALARATRAHLATVYRWRSGELDLGGTALTAVLAIIKHPGEYEHHKRGRRR